MKKYAPLIAIIFYLFLSFSTAIAAEVSAEATANSASTSASSSASASASGSGACATCIGCATIKITVASVPGQYYRMVTIDFRFPAGFPSWVEETRKVTYTDPLLVLSDKIENIETERMSPGKLIKAQAYFWTDGGCLVVRRVFAANPGEFITLLATTWAGLKYELAIDKPGSVINKIYCLFGLVELAQRSDRSYGFRIK